MSKRLLLHTSYWVLILLFLTIVFGFSWQSHLLAFFFAILLLPVVMVSSYFFNLFLVPRYLLTKDYKRFALYFLYMIVLSLYLEMLVALFSFVIIAETNTALVDLEGISIFKLGMTLYLIVFITGFINMIIHLQQTEKHVETLRSDLERNEQQTLLIRADRKNHLIPLDTLIYIESLNDQVKVFMENDELLTREKITSLAEKLPDQFIRIHRSFLVNADKVISYTSTTVEINDTTLPISRTYKQKALDLLDSGK